MTTNKTTKHSHGPGHGGPARGTRSFATGNLVRMTSGHRTPAVYGQLAEQLAAGLIEDRPDLAAYPEAVAAWATAEAQVSLLRRHLDEVGPIDPVTNEPRATSLYWLARLEASAAKRRTELGLDPRSEAALARDRAAASLTSFDLVQLAERGRDVLEAREAAGIAPPPDLAGQALEAARRAEPPMLRGEGTPRRRRDEDDTGDDTDTDTPDAATTATHETEETTP